MRDESLPETGWRDVGRRGIAQARAALAARTVSDPPEGRGSQWADSGAGHAPVVCEHLAWRETDTPGVVECEWCWTVATLEELHATRPDPEDTDGPF